MMNQNYTTMSNSKIPACKKSFQYGLFALKVGDKLNAAKRYDQASQYVRSSTSIGANLSEAKAASSDRDFIAKVSISLKEAHESQFWTELLYQAGYISEEDFEEGMAQVNELIALLSTTINNRKEKIRNSQKENQT